MTKQANVESHLLVLLTLNMNKMEPKKYPLHPLKPTRSPKEAFNVALPYSHPNIVGEMFPHAPISTNSPWAVPLTEGSTEDCNTAIVGPNQHSATRYSIASHTIAISKLEVPGGVCVAKYQVGIATIELMIGISNSIVSSSKYAIMVDDESPEECLRYCFKNPAR